MSRSVLNLNPFSPSLQLTPELLLPREVLVLDSRVEIVKVILAEAALSQLLEDARVVDVAAEG